MFVDASKARKLENAEAEVQYATVAPLVGSERAPEAFTRRLGQGVATFVRAGSPFNKVIGGGLTGPLDEAALVDLERSSPEPLRFELCTLAAPETFAQLSARGYQLVGFENVLAQALDSASPPPGDIRIEPVHEGTLAAFRRVLVEAFAHADGTGVVVDQFTRTILEQVFDDSLAAREHRRYLAYRDDTIAGGASMRVHDGVAVLTGSATLPEHRRHGVQAALLTRRLQDARTQGAELAMITTAPGSQSQANVTKAGFSLAYARAVLVRNG